jgi:hypothetical protein
VTDWPLLNRKPEGDGRGKADFRIARWLAATVFAAVTIWFGAYIFETPADEKVAKAFHEADPTADLKIVETGPLTYRTVRRGRYFLQTRQEVATTLWCAQDRRRPERRMAIEYLRTATPLASGPRTLAQSWVLGRGITADEILVECERRTAPPSPRPVGPGSAIPVPQILGAPALP